MSGACRVCTTSERFAVARDFKMKETMKEIIRVIIGIIIIFLFQGKGFAQYINNSNLSAILGEWKVTTNVPMSVSALTDEETAALMGRSLILSLNDANILGDSCNKIKYDINYYETTNFLINEYGMSKEELGISSNTIMVVEVTCLGSSRKSVEFDYTIFYDKKRIFINYDGEILILTKSFRVSH
jgi:hypothetical protein